MNRTVHNHHLVQYIDPGKYFSKVEDLETTPTRLSFDKQNSFVPITLGNSALDWLNKRKGSNGSDLHRDMSSKSDSNLEQLCIAIVYGLNVNNWLAHQMRSFVQAIHSQHKVSEMQFILK